MSKISAPPGHGPVAVSGQPSVAQLRHRAEVPMLIMGGALTGVGAAGAVGLARLGFVPPEWMLVALGALLVPVAASIMIRYQYWAQIANGVEVTPHQFPELFREYHAIAERMGLTGQGMQALPQLYVVNGNGALNAYASKCQLNRGYAVIYSDLVDVAYELNDFNTVRFVLAHELGHIKCGHVSLWRLALYPVANTIGLGPSITRAQEYTADRAALYYAPEGKHGLIVLYAGKRMYRQVNHAAYVDSVNRHKDGFWLRLVNLLSSHAVGFRRMEAIHLSDKQGWDVQGRMI